MPHYPPFFLHTGFCLATSGFDKRARSLHIRYHKGVLKVLPCYAALFALHIVRAGDLSSRCRAGEPPGPYARLIRHLGLLLLCFLLPSTYGSGSRVFRYVPTWHFAPLVSFRSYRQMYSPSEAHFSPLWHHGSDIRPRLHPLFSSKLWIFGRVSCRERWDLRTF